MSSDLSSGAHGSPEKKKNVGFISLGCDKNRVDTEKAIAIVRDAGYRVTDDVKKADIIVINTCAFIKSAVKEARQHFAPGFLRTARHFPFRTTLFYAALLYLRIFAALIKRFLIFPRKESIKRTNRGKHCFCRRKRKKPCSY